MKKILLIEDQDDLRENTAEILELANYKVVTAENGKVGVEKAIAEKPDLIICDIMMPVLDGYGVLHMIQKLPDLAHIPFIFLSAKSERSDIRKGMELGADDYISKPFNGTELLSAIEQRLKKYESFKAELPDGLAGIDQLHLLNGNKLDINKIIQNRSVNKYKKKQIIYNEGNKPSRLYYILKGKVRQFKINDDAKELVVGLLNEGDFLGYVPLIENDVYKDTAEAMEDTELAILPREEFDDMMKKDTAVIRKFTQLLAKNVSEKSDHLISLAYNSLRKKVAQALMSLVKKFKTPDMPNYVIDMSREGLASIAGTATESLIRTLTDFKAEKLIDIKDGKIIILNESKLDNLFN